MTAPRGVYPFATQDGKAIPLDIIAAKSLIYQNFVETGSGTAVTIPANAEVGTVYADEDCLVRFGGDFASLAANTELEDAFFLPAGTVVTVALTAGTAYILGVEAAGRIYIQVIDKWAGLGLTTQYVRK